MRIRRLGWAGVELEAGGEVALIDAVTDMEASRPLFGAPHTALPEPSAVGTARLALVTHLHFDHTDASAVARALAPGGVVLRPRPGDGSGLETIGTLAAETALAEAGLTTRIVEPWETVESGPYTVTALPAADAFGDPQVSWLVEAGGTRVLHAGDTLHHGWWWLAKMRHGPIDVAFLPVNGAIVNLPHRQPPSPLPASMGPEQAAAAAAVLEARLAVAIHYDTLHAPPVYAQVDAPADRFARACAALGVRAAIVPPGDELTEVATAPQAAAP